MRIAEAVGLLQVNEPDMTECKPEPQARLLPVKGFIECVPEVEGVAYRQCGNIFSRCLEVEALRQNHQIADRNVARARHHIKYRVCHRLRLHNAARSQCLFQLSFGPIV